MKKIFATILLQYFRFFARFALAAHRPVVIGIAGSVGKSSTKEILRAALQPFGKTLATEGNSETGLPLSMLGVHVEGYRLLDWIRYAAQAPFGIFNLVGVDFLIAEMGIDSPLPPKNMAYLLTIVEPDIAVIVQESAAHTENFEPLLTAEERANLSDEKRLQRLIDLIIQEDLKMAMTDRCTTLIYNADNEQLAKSVKALQGQGKKLFAFGSSNHLDVYYLKSAISLDETRFDLMVLGAPVTVKYNHAVLPAEYRELTAAALLACSAVGVNVNQAGSAIEKNVVLPKGRATILKGINHSVILDSSYNASKASMIAFLDLVDRLKKQTNRVALVVLGDMRELGTESKIEHESVAKKILEVADLAYCVGDQTKEYVMPLLKDKVPSKWFQNSKDLGSHLKEHIPEQAIVLFKGSQNTIFLEEAIKSILADKRDASALCRQEEYWLRTKSKSGF